MRAWTIFCSTCSLLLASLWGTASSAQSGTYSGVKLVWVGQTDNGKLPRPDTDTLDRYELYGPAYQACSPYIWSSNTTLNGCLNASKGTGTVSIGQAFFFATNSVVQAEALYNACHPNRTSALCTVTVDRSTLNYSVTSNTTFMRAKVVSSNGTTWTIDAALTEGNRMGRSFMSQNVTGLTEPPKDAPPGNCTAGGKTWTPGMVSNVPIQVSVLNGQRIINPGDSFVPKQWPTCEFKVFFCLSIFINNTDLCHIAFMGTEPPAGRKEVDVTAFDVRAMVKDQLKKLTNERAVPSPIPYGTQKDAAGNVTAKTDSCKAKAVGLVVGDPTVGGAGCVPMDAERKWDEATPYVHPDPTNLCRDNPATCSTFDPKAAWSPSKTVPASQLSDPTRLVTVDQSTNTVRYVTQQDITNNNVTLPPNFNTGTSNNGPTTANPNAPVGSPDNPSGSTGDGDSVDEGALGDCKVGSEDDCATGAQSGLPTAATDEDFLGSLQVGDGPCAGEGAETDICKFLGSFVPEGGSTSGDVTLAKDTALGLDITIPSWALDIARLIVLLMAYIASVRIILGISK